MSQNPFPKDFFWGASTASHQVEGGTVNQWSEWELAHAAELAKTAEKRLGWLPNWDEIKRQAADPNNYVSGTGVDHYRRYEEDFNLAKQLNLNAFRFGIEWSRIEPEEGQWDEQAIEHYRRYIKELRARGLEPFLNIWHWTNPDWFEGMGGFAKRKNIAYFERFVAKLTDALLDDVTYVLTINEANNFAVLGYLTGLWPPSEKNPFKTIQVYRNLALAHRRAYHILKTEKPSLQISSAHNVAVNLPYSRRNPVDRAVAWLANYAWQWWWYNRSRRQHDFIGMNFYYTNYYHWFKMQNPTSPLSDMGLYTVPERVQDAILAAHRRYKRPIIITENGIADATDAKRKHWLEQTIRAIGASREAGADVRGYLHWSLLDNFEWQEGWWPKFGLIAVDREHDMTRTIKPSAKTYAMIIKRFNS